MWEDKSSEYDLHQGRDKGSLTSSSIYTLRAAHQRLRPVRPKPAELTAVAHLQEDLVRIMLNSGCNVAEYSSSRN